jgi:hypothetical protein
MAAETAPAETGVDSLGGQILHCAKPMAKRSERVTWTGKPGEGAQYTTIDLRCGKCGATGTLTLTEEC